MNEPKPRYWVTTLVMFVVLAFIVHIGQKNLRQVEDMNTQWQSVNTQLTTVVAELRASNAFWNRQEHRADSVRAAQRTRDSLQQLRPRR